MTLLKAPFSSNFYKIFKYTISTSNTQASIVDGQIEQLEYDIKIRTTLLEAPFSSDSYKIFKDGIAQAIHKLAYSMG